MNKTNEFDRWIDRRDWLIVVALGLVPQLTYTAFKILGI